MDKSYAYYPLELFIAFSLLLARITLQPKLIKRMTIVRRLARGATEKEASQD